MATKQGGDAPIVGPSSSPEEVLAFLTGLLGKGITKDEDDKTSHVAQDLAKEMCAAIPWEHQLHSTHAVPSEDREADDDDDVEGTEPDFSSFPSLSLERSPHEELEGDLSHRAGIEAHVSSLLARPILVSNASNSTNLSDYGEDGDTLEFIAENFLEVPNAMLQNFFNSFSTLMNSRLRAYATFLTRHWLSLFECSETAQELEEGVTGVEQKLETMLEIGRLVSSDAVVTSFQARPQEGTTTNPLGDGTEKQVSMPLVMDASIVISLPHPLEEGSELVTVSFRANGNITGTCRFLFEAFTSYVKAISHHAHPYCIIFFIL
jgi:hypothetical protein